MVGFNEKEFFAKQAKRLQDSGALQTYATPLGEKRDWHSFIKKAHTPQDVSGDYTKEPVMSQKDAPGLVFHMGDEPYNVLTTAQVQYYREIDIKPADIKLKAASVMKAIRAYMPDDVFEQYLDHFVRNLDKRENKAALKATYKNLVDQLSCSGERVGTEELRRIEREGGSNDLRGALGRSQLAAEAGKHPELLLTIAIYQAAQASYVERLNLSIQRSWAISRDEKENAQAVAKSPFRQFGTSLLFGTMVPLTLLSRQDMPQAPGQSEDDMMKGSITAAWKRLFDDKVLTRSYSEKEVPPDKPGGKVELTCPAINQLRGARDRGSLEKVYAHVTSHRKELAGALNDIAQAARGISTTPCWEDRQQARNHAEPPPVQAGAPPEERPGQRCPMRKLRGGFVALAMAGTTLIPGHDVPPKMRPDGPANTRKWGEDIKNMENEAPKNERY